MTLKYGSGLDSAASYEMSNSCSRLQLYFDAVQRLGAKEGRGQDCLTRQLQIICGTVSFDDCAGNQLANVLKNVLIERCLGMLHKEAAEPASINLARKKAVLLTIFKALRHTASRSCVLSSASQTVLRHIR